MRNIETFESEEKLLGRIEQLKTDGIKEESITVVSGDSLEKSSFDYTNINIKSAEGTAWDKIVSFFSSEDSEERVMAGMDLSDEEEQKFKNALDNGKILLYVNGDGADSIAKEPVTDDSQDTVHSDEQAEKDATNMTAAGTAGNAGVAGVTAHDDNAGNIATEEEIEQDISRENTGGANLNPGNRNTDNDDYKAVPSGEYDKNQENSANQIHNPANEEGVSLDKSREAHDHSEKLQEDDTHLAYGEGTDEHIAVDPSVNTATEESDAEKIERHKDPDYLENEQEDYHYKNKKTIINEYKMDDRRDQHLVDTHNHPEIAEEISPEEEKNTGESDRQPLDKDFDNRNRDYSIKNDINGEQVIRLNDEER